jgi:hypothetical protein
MSRKIGQVSFNLKDPGEKELHDYCSKYPNFSGFIKRLIQNAINGQQPMNQTHVPEMGFKPSQPKESNDFDSNMMKQFL